MHIQALFSRQAFGTYIRRLIVRFPIILAITVITTVCFIRTALSNGENYRLVFAAALAFPWTIFAALLAERFEWRRLYSLFVQLGTALLAVSYYFLFPSDVTVATPIAFIRWGILVVIGCIAFLSLPYDFKDAQRLWYSGAKVIRSALIALIFGIGLALGLMLATFAVSYLFGILNHHEDTILTYVNSIVFGIFTTWLFLAQLPSPKNTTPVGLGKIPQLFLEYIWLPVVAVFLAILYVYFGKILVTWHWPEGGVANWVLGFLSLGFLAYLISYTTDTYSPRAKLRYFNTFFLTGLPMLGILFLAIGLRIQQYGITEKRYLVVAGGILLLILSCYYRFSKTKKIQFIPYLVALFLLVASVGPFNMFSVSLASQTHQLQHLLEKNQMLQNGKIVSMKNETQLPPEDVERITSIVRYLVDFKGLNRIQPWFAAPIEIATSGYETERNILKSLGFTTNGYVLDTTQFSFANYPRNRIPQTIDVRNYDYVIEAVRMLKGNQPEDVSAGDFGNFRFSLNQPATITMLRNGVFLGSIDLAPLIRSLRTTYGTKSAKQYLRDDELTQVIQTNKGSLQFIITDISGDVQENGTVSIWDISFTILGSR